MSVPKKIWLYRITHIDNLSHIFKHGLVTEHSENKNPGFIKIGDSSLIDIRKDLDAPVPPRRKVI